MYLIWDKKTITDFSDKNINSLYNEGYLFTRTGKGDIYQTRSVRVDLEKFKLNSENRRVLRHTENIILEVADIPYTNYHWGIHKLGRDFYSTKFGDKTFSAQKIKELITDDKKSNFNKLLVYSMSQNVILSEAPVGLGPKESLSKTVGNCIAFENKNILHYSYPFYDLNSRIHNLGIGMMTKAIVWAQEQGKKYVYLGSYKDDKAKYKLQFEGVEWFDGKKWTINLEKLKKEIK